MEDSLSAGTEEDSCKAAFQGPPHKSWRWECVGSGDGGRPQPVAMLKYWAVQVGCRKHRPCLHLKRFAGTVIPASPVEKQFIPNGVTCTGKSTEITTSTLGLLLALLCWSGTNF